MNSHQSEGEPVPRRNLERKTRCDDLTTARTTLRELGARREGVQEQTDTFFRARAGRLKLRTIEGQPAVLIWYDRPDAAAVRPSAYYLVPVSDAALLGAALAAGLGLRGEVRKRREVWHWHNVRIHLDEVAGLGRFVEFEAVLSGTADEAPSHERLDQLGRALGLLPAQDVAGAYADLLGL